jgi:hypothetical protein
MRSGCPSLLAGAYLLPVINGQCIHVGK